MAEQDKKIAVYVGADISEYIAAMRRVQAATNSTMNDVERSSAKTRKSILSLSTAITALKVVGLSALPTIAGGAGALGSAFAAAGAGVFAFGAVAKSVLGEVFDASKQLEKAQEALDKAGNAKERAKALEMQKEALKGLTAEQQKAVVALQNFKSFWDSFAKSFEKPVVSVFASGLNTLQGVLNNLKPAFQGSMEAIKGLMDSLSKGLKTKDMQAFFNWLGTTAGPTITAFGQIAGNIFRGIANLLVAFSPLISDVQNGLLNMSESFAKWTSKLSQSKGFQMFLDYVRTNGPVIVGIIRDIADIVGTLVVALAPIAQVILQAFGALTNALSNIINGIKTAFSNLNFEGVIGVFSVLGGQLSTSLMNGILQTLPALGGQLVTLLLNAILQAVPMIIQGIVTLVTTIVNTLNQFIASYAPILIQAGLTLLQSLMNGLVNNLPVILQAVITLITTFINVIIQNLPLIINAGTKMLNSLVNGIINMMPQLTQMAFRLITAFFTSLINNLPQIIQAGIRLLEAVVNGITRALPQLAQMAVILIIRLAAYILQNLPQIIAAGVKILLALIEGLLKTIPQLLAAIPKIVKAIFDAFGKVNWWEIGKGIITGIGQGIKNFASSVFGTVEDIASSLLARGKAILGIHSPSKVFAQEVGKWIPAGIAVGIRAETDVATDAVNDVGKALTLSGSNIRTRSMDISLPSRIAANNQGNQITININNPVVREEQDIRQLANEIAKVLKWDEKLVNRAGGIQFGY